MIYPHVIRLAGPWEYEVLRCDANDWTGATSGRTQLPLDCRELLGASFRGLVTFRRRFNRPTNLDPQEAVWLVIEADESRGEIGLNGNLLGDLPGNAGLAELDVSTALELHNELTIRADQSVSIAGVRLEIRRRLPLPTSVE